MYQEWNTIIGDSGEFLSKYSDKDTEQIKTITEYLNKLKTYFDNETRIVY